MDETTQKFLSVRDLEVIYTSGRKTVHAVNGISFDMDKGETLALVGETGAGKTTIAKAILGILPNPPARLKQGRIILEGEDLLKKPAEEMLKIRGGKIAMIFQDPMTALNPIMTVGGADRGGTAAAQRLYQEGSGGGGRENAGAGGDSGGAVCRIPL